MRIVARAIIVKDGQLLVMHRNKFGNEYYALVGGGVDFGETVEQALYREIAEETTISFTNPRLVIEEDAGAMYGMQYIFLCDYSSGEPTLDPKSAEYQITQGGKNLYKPLWLPINDLPTTNLQPVELKEALVAGLRDGFGTEPIKLTVRS